MLACVSLSLSPMALGRTLSPAVIKVDVPAPTKDKPQSKLWFAHGTWWAWLPVRNGSSIWRRTPRGWQRQSELDAALLNHPGQADVWAAGNEVCAVLVDPQRLSVIRLEWEAQSRRYRLAGQPVRLNPPESTGEQDAIETATIARDTQGRWWVAYNRQRMIWLRTAPSAGDHWTQPIPVCEKPVSADDICAIVAVQNRVGVFWSDQNHDAVYFRTHKDQSPPSTWETVEVADQGNKTADDHINIATASDGTLYVATKNSVDRVGQPQHVLRVRDASGKWKNYPYATLTSQQGPTRPIVQLGGNPAKLFLLHTIAVVGRRPAESLIACQTTDPGRIQIAAAAQPLIEAETATAVNNVTGSKARLPQGAPWIVLASDPAGNVYEARLDQFAG